MKGDSDLLQKAEEAVIAGDAPALANLFRDHADYFRDLLPLPSGRKGGRNTSLKFTKAAQSLIAKQQHFKDWEEFEKFRKARKRANSPIARFESAAEAIVEGDLATLKRLLREHPELVQARSVRNHHSTLLHYVGSNGIEGFRQKAPKNIVKIAEALLDAGAEVDATANMYGGGSTTLGLAATSIHPALAGVQDALLEFLLRRGAKIDGPSLINGCHMNGRPGAAAFLAKYGAPMDLEGAAGAGRLDLVKSYFDKNGKLKRPATKQQMKDGFAWACEYGKVDVVDFLLKRGMKVSDRLKHHGQIGLHWAAHEGHVETLKLLIKRGSDVNAKDKAFKLTPLGWVLHGWSEVKSNPSPNDYYEVAALLARAGSKIDPEFSEIKDQRMLAALRGEFKRK